MKNISAVIVAKNEADNIEECISALSFVEEVIVVDDESTDDTEKLAKSLGGKVFTRKLDSFAKQRNFGAEKASNDWILSIDADEVVNNDLAGAIEDLDPNLNGYQMLWKNMFLGQTPKSLQEWHFRIYNKKQATWVGDVHEHIEVQGEIAKIQSGFVLHKSNNSMHEFLEKRNSYTDLEIEKMGKFGLTKIYKGLLLSPFRRFFRAYLKNGSWRDGFIGLIWALYTAIYQIDMYAKAYEKHWKEHAKPTP